MHEEVLPRNSLGLLKDMDKYHVLRSLAWFEDAEKEPMPRMLLPFDWDACKAFFCREARKIVMDDR